MSKILLGDWSADFAICDEHEKSRMKDVANRLASLVSSLSLGREEMPIEEYVQLAWEEIVDAEHITVELVDLAWSR